MRDPESDSAHLPPGHLLLPLGGVGRVPPLDDVLDGVGETLLGGVTVVTPQTLGVEGGDDAVFLLQ